MASLTATVTLNAQVEYYTLLCGEMGTKRGFLERILIKFCHLQHRDNYKIHDGMWCRQGHGTEGEEMIIIIIVSSE